MRDDTRPSRVPMALLGIYAVLFTVLAIDPVDRPTWFVENLTVWIILAVVIALYACRIRFSNTAYVLMSVLIYLHTIGGHWTFALVPFGWVTDFFGFERDNFDRVAHFSVGLYAFAVAEWLWEGGLHRSGAQLVANRFLLFTYPVFAVAFIAMGYELVEWVFAISAAPEAGAAYLGSQGDIWDAQKDMLADTLGALVATTAYFILRRPKFRIGERTKETFGAK